MKSRKSMITLGIAALVLFLGVGYAVVTGVDLTISGTATANSNLAVVFNGTTSTDKTNASTNTTVTATSVEDGLTATINVTGLEKKGDYVTATYTIVNKEEDIDALITLNSITPASDTYFEVTTDLGDGKTITKGGANTTTVTITVKLKAVPVSAADSTESITVVLDAEPKAQS